MNRVITSVFLLASLALVSSSTADLSAQPGTIEEFTDVRGNAAWTSAIRDLAAGGYVRGRSPGEFAPEAAVTQAEMAVFLLRAANGPAFSPPATSGEWWEGWAAEAESEGLMSHLTDPEAPATRAQVATLLWLGLDSQP